MGLFLYMSTISGAVQCETLFFCLRSCSCLAPGCTGWALHFKTPRKSAAPFEDLLHAGAIHVAFLHQGVHQTVHGGHPFADDLHRVG